MSMKKMLITAAALLAGSAALAQTPPPAPVAPPAPPAQMAHPMHDKVTTRAETVEKVREHFARLDANKDGVITTAEVTEGHTKMVEQFRKHPGGAWQGENAVHVMREAHRDPNAAFDRLDANKDGAISREEFAKAREERIERRIVMQGEEGGKDGKDVRKQVMRMHGPRGFGGRMIVMADTDKDGRITLAEAEALALQHFDQLDANKDGQVTPEERRAGRPMIIKRMIEEEKTAS
ncbi:MAG TPA: EF-hand domain-containing protein [Sphingomicrobium sp.]|nr:EF-hand domain-containing protein [Sphingomicrobium sp.]